MTGIHIGFNAHLLSFRSDYRRAGVSQYTEQILRHMLPKIVRNGDFTTIFRGPDDWPWAFVAERVKYRDSRLPTGIAPARIVWEQCAAPIITARAGLDVFFCPVNVVPLAGRVPSVVTVHDLAFIAHPEAYHASKRRYLSVMTRLSVHRARRVIAVSTHTKDDLVRHFSVAPDKITVIPNAIDTRFQPADDLAAFKAAHSLPDRFVLFVGTLEPRKNLRRLIEAFARVAEHDADIGLVIVGASGWLTSDIAPLVATLRLTKRVTFTGYVSDEELPSWYQAATVFCYPSLYEGFGLPVLEAMACGRPIVTSNTSSLPELAGDAAVLIDPTDMNALAEALMLLLADPERRTDLATRGLHRAQSYSWERTAAETLAVLHAAARRN